MTDNLPRFCLIHSEFTNNWGQKRWQWKVRDTIRRREVAVSDTTHSVSTTSEHKPVPMIEIVDKLNRGEFVNV